MTSKAFARRASFMARTICLIVLLNLLALDFSGAVARVGTISTDDGTGVMQYPLVSAAAIMDRYRMLKYTTSWKPAAARETPVGTKPGSGNMWAKRDIVAQMLDLGIGLYPITGGQGTGMLPDTNDPNVTNPKQSGQEDANAPAVQNNPKSPDIELIPVVSQAELSKIYKRKDEKVVYLTFDDGPTSSCTPLILDILAEENVKATFFLIGSQAKRHPDLVKRQYAEGHGIGNHSYTHAFKKIYSDTDYFMEELYKTERLLQSILGTDKRFLLMRFPGGSYGERLAPFRERANEGGFIYIDWNCQTGDAESSTPRTPAELIDRFMKTARGKNSLVVLMHDSAGKMTTVEALPEIIRYLKAEGYRFELLPGSRGS